MNTAPAVICFASSKGGTGKTTSAIILAMTLASQGRKVAVIDADPNQPIVHWRDAVHVKQQRGGEGVPANLVVGGFPDTRDEMAPRIIDTINQARDAGAEFILVDLEGRAQMLVLYATSQADLVLIPCRGSQLDAEQAARVLETLEGQRKLTGRAIPYRVMLTCTGNIKTGTTRAIEKQLDLAGLTRLPADLKDREAFRAIFSFRTLLSRLTVAEVRNIGSALDNANNYAAAVLACLETRTAKETTRA